MLAMSSYAAGLVSAQSSGSESNACAFLIDSPSITGDGHLGCCTGKHFAPFATGFGAVPSCCTVESASLRDAPVAISFLTAFDSHLSGMLLIPLDWTV